MLLAVLTLVALSQSEPQGYALSWKVPCAPAPVSSELVGDAVGAAEVAVTPRGSGWRLVVRFLAPVAGERVMQTETCEQAAQASLLVIRLAGRDTAPAATGVPDPAPPLVEATVPPSAQTISPPRFSLAVAALAQQGPLPELAPRLGVTVGLEWAEHWLGLFSLRVGLPMVVAGGPTPGARVRVQPILGGQVSACWQGRVGRFSGGPCALTGIEVWDVSGENVTQPLRGAATSVVGGLDARGALQLWEGLSVTAALGGRVAFVRPSIAFQDSGLVFQSSLFSAEGEIGLRWTW